MDTTRIGAGAPNLICFSHLRWDFVLQRPQHLMTRFAKTWSVTFWEEALEVLDAPAAKLKVETREDARGRHPRDADPAGGPIRSG